jgi:HAD superfamily hydrolase (TIGR01458 family)
VHERASSIGRVRGVLLDLGGVVYVGNTPVAGAIDAIDRLRGAGLLLRFITNTTRRCRRQVIDDLRRMGLQVSEDELLTPALMARDYLKQRGLSPALLVHPDLEEDFAGLSTGRNQAVVVGDAGHTFTYERLNAAYRKLVDGAELLALAMNRNFMDDDGRLSLDAGPFVTGLEYASRTKAILFGKPSAAFFDAAVRSLACARDEVVMIGDDAESDVGGAIQAGITGILVKTGKYRAGDEDHLPVAPACIAGALQDAAEKILNET